MSWTKPSNFDLELVSYGKDHLVQAIKLVMTDEKATHFQVSPVKAGELMKLFWHEGPGASALPFPATAELVAETVWAWLQQAKYPEQPDFDGSTTKGFKLHTHDASSGWSYVIFTVETEWALFGK